MTRPLQDNCRRYIACMVTVCKDKTTADKIATYVEKIRGIVDQAKAGQVLSVHCFCLTVCRHPARSSGIFEIARQTLRV